jgi:hypothetical protein
VCPSCDIGQEEAKVDIEDGIRFTPFNLKEEYEEGEFDADGMFLFKKNKARFMCMLIVDFSCNILVSSASYNFEFKNFLCGYLVILGFGGNMLLVELAGFMYNLTAS